MSIYVDTSVLVALHLAEPHSNAVAAWFVRRTDPDLICSDWTIVEHASALSKKLRTNRITDNQRTNAEHAFALTQKLMRRIDVQAVHFTRASEMVRHHATGLRAADALHLAIAQHQSASLATLDLTLAQAAGYFHVALEAMGD